MQEWRWCFVVVVVVVGKLQYCAVVDVQTFERNLDTHMYTL
jgi:hypothetical protein